MWSAIIQAIDHSLGRMNEGAGAGIKVANAQGGGGAPISNPDSDAAGSAAKLAQDHRNTNEGNSEQAEAAEEAKIGSNATKTGIPGDDGAASSAGDTAGDAGSIVSDENTKSAKNVSSDKVTKTQGKLEAARKYGANVSKGFANAGAIATGSKAAEWENIDTSVAKKAAEDTVKNWRNHDFNSNTDKQTETKEGK